MKPAGEQLDRTSRTAFAVAGALFVLLYGRVLFAPAGHSPATGDSDFYMYYLPMTEMAFGQVREGILPVWNPYLFSGMPLLASIEVGVLYPPNWLHVVLPSERAFCLLCVLHVLLAGAGSWWLARRLGHSSGAAVFSALAFALAAPTVLRFDMGMVTVVYSSAWIPLILALVDRCLERRSAGAAIALTFALACQFLAGFPMFTALLSVLISAWILFFGLEWRRPLFRQNLGTVGYFAGVAALALGLAMPQLLPTLKYLENSVRGELDYHEATHCSLPALNLITLLIPDFFGNDKDCPYWGEAFVFDANIFCGTTTVLLALVSVYRWKSREFQFWAVTVAVSLALALGKYSYFYDVCFAYCPGVDRFRGMARLSIFAVLGITQLAAIGWDELRRRPAGGGLGRWGLGATVASALALGACLLAWKSASSAPAWWEALFDWVRRPGTELFSSVPIQNRSQVLVESFRVMLRSAAFSAVVALAAGTIVWLRGRGQWKIQFIGPALVALLAIELFAFDSKYVLLMDSNPFRSIAKKVRAALPADDELFRVAGFSTDPPIVPNRLLYGRLQTVGGHENFVLSRYSLFLHFWTGIGPDRQTNLTVPNFDRIYDFLNVKYFLTPRHATILEPGDELIRRDVFEFQGRRFDLYRNNNCVPRLLLVHRARIVRDLPAAAALLEDLHRGSIYTDSIVESREPIELGEVDDETRAQESVTLIEYRPARLVAEVRCAAPAILICASNYYPAWEADVDGRKVQVRPANICMRAIPVPAGQHRVELEYRPTSFRTGCLCALVSLVGMSGLSVVSRWRRSRR